jgi:hypothetical protein
MGTGISYNFSQVLVTPDKAVPRAESGFFVPLWLAPMGDGSVRKAGRPSLSGLRTSPARAFVSAERL